MKSITYGDVDITKIRTIIESRIHHNESLTITVGTDSQSFANYTKLVNVIVVRINNRGGFFFYDCEYVSLMKSLHDKLVTETLKSIETAYALLMELKKSNMEIIREQKIIIHSDIGVNGPTNKLINEIVGWITASGFDCEIKPQSFAASSVANKLSK